MNNPLLENHSLPAFSRIRPEHVEAAIDSVLNDNRARIRTLLEQGGRFDWQTFVEPLEDMADRLERVWSPVRHLNAVMNNDDLRAAYNVCLSKLSEYATDLGQNEGLFIAYQSIAAAEIFTSLEVAQQKAIKDALRDFHLSGVDLPETQRARFKEIQQQLSSLHSRFEENVLDATNAWKKPVIDKAILSGLPASALAMARQAAHNQGQDGWLINLEYPCYHAVMTYADNRELRREVYTAFNTRASDQGPHAGQWDNSAVMEQILALRHEAAELLGYANYAERSLATKMAETEQSVLTFLRDLASRARPKAEKELEELCEYASVQLGIDDIASWDLPYVSEKLKQHRYAFSEEELKPWFQVDQVLQGLFELVGRIYGLVIREKKGVDSWHSDVSFYEISDSQGRLRGQFYLDLYAREHKRGGAWMDVCVARMRRGDSVQIPVAYMTCNGTPPVDGKPALFTHNEVITLFHEFGHGLHHMLTLVDYPSVAGISGVEWDAVELPSQFMENWCWQREALDLFARHHETGDCIPETLFQKLLASQHFNAGLQTLRQVEFALFDFRLHLEYQATQGARVEKILDEVRDEVAVIKPPEFVRFQHGFSHIFAGGYAAGYYSYKWAEVLSADVFAAFEEQGLFNQETGQAFLHSILERGGSEPAMVLFRNFRQREPSIDALLRHSGLAA